MTEATTRVHLEDGRLRLFRRRYRLQVLGGPDRGAVLETARETVTIGSARWNDLVLHNPTVSRHHLRIKVLADGFLLTDLESTNGTAVGNLRLHQAVGRGQVDLLLGDCPVRLTPLLEEEEVPLLEQTRFGDIVGQSAPMRELFRKLQQIAARDATVLIQGETGTGKELVAREIHRHGSRAQHPFVVVDCGAIPPALVESELFGIAMGAFTGADVSRAGPFEEAERGTIFLDEVGELPQEMQPKLLRLLERKEVRRLGELQYRPVDVRIIAATNRELARAVNQGTFRADLYYRLAVVNVTVPPLRERPEDIALLIDELWPQIAPGAVDQSAIDADSRRQMLTHPWPGNVRELRNALERLAVFSGRAPDREGLLQPLLDPPEKLPDDLLHALPLREARGYFERQYLQHVLARCGYNVAEAARLSGIDRVHVYRLMKKYGLQSPDPL